MARKVTIELEDGRILKGEVVSAVNHAGAFTGPLWEVEVKTEAGDTIIWKQPADGGRLLHIDD